MQPATVMTIAGSDSGGGAGIEADLRTFAALAVHGTAAVTAITAQNTYEVRAVCALEAEMVRAQIETVADDFELTSVKTGMLARPATIRAVAELAREGRLPNLVVDPVLVTSTGHPLMEAGGVDAYRDLLLPQARVATPNLRETAVLIGAVVSSIDSVEAMASAGEQILKMGPEAVVIKGGHFQADSATASFAPDVVVSRSGHRVLSAPRVATSNDHGTGCTLAAAIAALIARGNSLDEAIDEAKQFVLRALRGAVTWQLGSGHGPIDHMGWNDQQA